MRNALRIGLRAAALAAAALLAGTAAAGDFVARWSKVTTLPTASAGAARGLTATLDAAGRYTCKVRIARGTAFTLWTAGLETNAASTVSLALSSSVRKDTWSTNSVARTAFTLSDDVDGNRRATLRPADWSSLDPTYVTFYFQLSGARGAKVALRYQGAAVAEVLEGEASRPRAFAPCETTTPAAWYGRETGACLTNGEYWLSADLNAGLEHCIGVATNVPSATLFRIYDPYGAQLDETTLEPFREWSDWETNVTRTLTHLTNHLERLSVVTVCQTVSNETLTATNLYLFAGVYTNDVDGVWRMTTNLLSAVTNVNWAADSVSHVVSVTTNFVRETLSVQTNVVCLTNVQHVGMCREAWRFTPGATGTYRFCFKGDAQAAFDLRQAVRVVYARVDFDAQGGTASFAQRAYIDGLAYGELPTATLSGCEFCGWHTNASEDAEVVASDVATTNVTQLYAHWIKTPTLTVAKVGDVEKCKVSPASISRVSGTTVRLKATAGSKHWFLGWYADAACTERLGTGKTLSYVMPRVEETTVYANFISAASVLKATTIACTDACVVTSGIPVGPISVSAASPLSTVLSASGLPAGLALRNGVICGTPTKASSAPVVATVTARNGAGRVTSRIAFTVEPLPAWATGSFDGACIFSGATGAVSVAVAASGKVSGKMSVGGKSYSFSVSRFDGVEADGALRATPIAKVGKTKRALPILISPADYDGAGGLVGVVAQAPEAEGFACGAGQNAWRRKDLAVPAYRKGAALACGNLAHLQGATLTWRKAGTGAATWAGRRNGKKVSGTAQSVLSGRRADGGWDATVVVPAPAGIDAVAFLFTEAGVPAARTEEEGE